MILRATAVRYSCDRVRGWPDRHHTTSRKTPAPAATIENDAEESQKADDADETILAAPVTRRASR